MEKGVHEQFLRYTSKSFSKELNRFSFYCSLRKIYLGLINGGLC